jgi:(1->4)-alpha-D-glucan 1-alpha-D-glucosylmutase
MAVSAPLSATYRLQFNKAFRFEEATQLVDYFSALGITHIYASPILHARRDSTHGYDVIDPTGLNPELGSESDFSALITSLKNRGMGLLLDVVPNHMSAGSENAWWMDVLENGPESAYASYFDINWHPPSRSLEGKILLPVLGRPFAEALESQELTPLLVDGRFFIQYFESLFPLAPKTYRHVLGRNLSKLKQTLGEESPPYQEYSGIVAGLASLFDAEPVKTAAVGDKRRQVEAIRERLRALVASNADVQLFLDENLSELRGRRGDPASFSALEKLLGEQFYVLSYWQNVNEEINYRRFFTITDLVGVRVEDPLVFEATHRFVKRMAEQQYIDGLRIDHIDGLRDPLGYLNRLTEQLSGRGDVTEAGKLPLYVEKILARDEQLPRDWPVCGTTGYDFLNALNCFFVNPNGAGRLEEIYGRFLGRELPYADVLYQKKKLVMTTLLGVEMRSLGHQLEMLAEDDRYARDLSTNDLTQALIETTAHLPVYRTYIRNLEVSAADKRVIEQALESAAERKFYLKPPTFRFVRDVLLLQNHPHLLPDQRESRLAFVTRWQQFTGPIMAKAFEDTFLYVYNPLISLNEVGGEPRPSVAASGDFLAFVKERSRKWPFSLNATTTHDTKRSEDVRARINVLSDIPEEWQEHLARWSGWNSGYKRLVDGQPVPDRNEEIFLYQTLLGAWPNEKEESESFLDRIQAYAVKATREAMVHTRWTVPNLPHERALKRFVAAILKPSADNRFRDDFIAFHQQIAYQGMINGLSQTLLKIFAPGIPDFYQGSELWDFRLVDPDNRRPVNFEHRRAMLKDLQERIKYPSTAMLDDLVHSWPDGRIKLYLIWKALNFRREHLDLFAKGEFLAARVDCSRRENAAAFVRRHRGQWAVAVVPRRLGRFQDSSSVAQEEHPWADTKICLATAAPASWVNVFTGEQIATCEENEERTIPVGQVLRHFPLALLAPVRTMAMDRTSPKSSGAAIEDD